MATRSSSWRPSRSATTSRRHSKSDAGASSSPTVEVWGLRFGVWGLGIWDSGEELEVEGVGFWDW